jgi:phage terminase small subunit
MRHRRPAASHCRRCHCADYPAECLGMASPVNLEKMKEMGLFMDGLKLKQILFCAEYSKDFNATQAAIRAGYSRKTAESQGCRLLTNVKIKAEIAKIIGRAVEKAEISLSWVLNELKVIASANMSNFATWSEDKATLRPSDQLSADLLSAVESVGETQDKAGRTLVKIRLHSKLAAIQNILKLYELTEIEARLAEIEEQLKK